MENIIIAILGSGAFSALVTGIINLINARQKAKKGSDEMILMLMTSQLYVMGESIITRGSVTFKELELYNDMYKLYKDKEGNGYVDELKSRISKLPISEMQK